MAIDHTSASLSHFPPLSEEMERTLCRLAWKDENFREALITDPKGVIQQVFHQRFPNGKLPDDLTIKVIEEDPATHYIILPPLPDEIATLEIPEEEQLDLIINMGSIDRKRSRESDDSQQSSKPTGERNIDITKQLFKAKETQDAKFPTKDEYEKARPLIMKDKQLLEMLRTNPKGGARLLFDRYFPGRKMPGGVDFKVLQNTADTHHMVLRSPNASQNIEALEEKQLDLLANMNFEGCKTKSDGETWNKGACGTHNCTDTCDPPCTANICY